MKSKYFVIEIKMDSISNEDSYNFMIQKAYEYNTNGIESYNLEEIEVDRILGLDSYCGGEIPFDVFERIENQADSQMKFYFDKIENLESFIEFLNNQEISFEKKEYLSEDWNESWRNEFKEFMVKNIFEVVPSWSNPTVEKFIKIYPGMGFGTGKHETTKMCLEFIAEYNIINLNQILDFGCGSGILGIAAKLLQPKSFITFYDIDDQAIENTNQNILHNNHLCFDENKNYSLLSHVDKKNIKNNNYDMILANILLDALLEEKEFLVHSLKAKGYLILSGLLNDQFNEIQSTYMNLGTLDYISMKKNGDWIALCFQKKVV